MKPTKQGMLWLRFGSTTLEILWTETVISTSAQNTITMCPTGTSTWCPRNIHISDLRSAFEVLDADRDGKISLEDLKISYTDADDDVIRTMMTVADSNKDGYVEYDEFEKVLRGDTSGSGGVMEDVFKAMDRDGDGKVGYGDLKSSLFGWT